MVKDLSFPGLSSLNSKRLEPKTCSERKCYYSENLFKSVWILSKVNLIFKNILIVHNFDNIRLCLDAGVVKLKENLWLINTCGRTMERLMVREIVKQKPKNFLTF